MVSIAQPFDSIGLIPLVQVEEESNDDLMASFTSSCVTDDQHEVVQVEKEESNDDLMASADQKLFASDDQLQTVQVDETNKSITDCPIDNDTSYNTYFDPEVEAFFGLNTDDLYDDDYDNCHFSSSEIRLRDCWLKQRVWIAAGCVFGSFSGRASAQLQFQGCEWEQNSQGERRVPEAYVQQLETSRLKLAQLEMELDRIGKQYKAMSDYLPEGIVEKIFLRLPVKCVIKCTAVSKSWRSLIKSSNFIQKHLSRAVRSNHHKNELVFLLGSFVEKERRTVFSLHWDNPEFGEYTRLEDPFHFINPCNLPLESQTTLHFHDVIGTCTGLICLADRDYQRKLIWNPRIRKFVILPNPSVNFTHTTTGKGRAIHAFGYDSHSNDYKVVRIMCIVGINWSLTPGEVEVYSLARDSWKRLNATAFPKDSRLSYGEEYAFVNGAVHWLAEHYKFRNRDNIIVWFDMPTESFGQILVPESLREESCYVSRYGESLA
nr:MYB transcription factor protein [Rosa persica]